MWVDHCIIGPVVHGSQVHIRSMEGKVIACLGMSDIALCFVVSLDIFIVYKKKRNCTVVSVI